MATLLVIGGTGFFGKSILDSFQRGLLSEFNIFRVIVLARNTDELKLQFPELVSNKVELINGDITKINTLPEAEYIIHCATSTNMEDYKQGTEDIGRRSIEDSIVNFCKVAPLLNSNSKILYCSSGAVYGKQPLHIEQIDETFKFESDLSNLSLEKRNYCLSKRFAEGEIINLGLKGLNVSIARCFAFTGKYLPKDRHYAYGNFVGQAEKGEKIQVYSQGVIYRSYLSADELVHSLMKILQVSTPQCPVYNVGSNKSISLHELAEIIALKYKVEFQHNITDFNNVLDRYVPNVNKLHRLLNK